MVISTSRYRGSAARTRSADINAAELIVERFSDLPLSRRRRTDTNASAEFDQRRIYPSAPKSKCQPGRTAASMEELNATVKKNAENANRRANWPAVPARSRIAAAKSWQDRRSDGEIEDPHKTDIITVIDDRAPDKHLALAQSKPRAGEAGAALPLSHPKCAAWLSVHRRRRRHQGPNRNSRPGQKA